MSMRTAGVLGLFLVLPALVSGCGSITVDSTNEPSRFLPVPTTEPDRSARLEWGPLAVIPPQDGTDLARAEGTLVITNRCVYLESGSERTLLYWPADRTTWNEEAGAITFLNGDGTSVTVTDTDPVVLGGGGDSESESGISGEAWMNRMTWVSPPDPSCAAERRFGVGIVAG
jgi:hypothetical protein